MTADKPKKTPQCGERRHVKVGTHSGQLVYVRRLRSSRGRELVVGSKVEFKLTRERYEKWQGPLNVWQVGDAPEHRLYLEWV